MRDREHTSNEQLVPCDIPERITVALNCTAAVAAAAANNNKYKSEMKYTKKNATENDGMTEWRYATHIRETLGDIGQTGHIPFVLGYQWPQQCQRIIEHLVDVGRLGLLIIIFMAIEFTVTDGCCVRSMLIFIFCIFFMLFLVRRDAPEKIYK